MKLLLSLLCIACSMPLAAKHQIKVTYTDLTSDTVIVQVIDKYMRMIEKTDTVIAKNGTFVYDVEGDKARCALVHVKNRHGRTYSRMFIVPGENGVLTGTSTRAVWSGSPFYAEYSVVDNQANAIIDQMNDINREYQRQKNAGVDEDVITRNLKPHFDELDNQLSQLKVDYVRNHPNSEVSMTLLTEIGNCEELFDAITPEVKNGRFSLFADFVGKNVERAKRRREAAEKMAPGR